MHLTGSPDEILAVLTRDLPHLDRELEAIKSIVHPNKRAVEEYQAAALYVLAHGYNRPGARFLEIGTAFGYSASALALGAPLATITTLNPHHDEAVIARANLEPYGSRVEVVEEMSWDYLAAYKGAPFDLIFVDGDHKNIRRDLPWRKHLALGGLIVFHDFSPTGSARPCPPVYRALLEFRQELQARQPGRDFDVLIVDDGGVGMAGYIKQSGDDLSYAASDGPAVAFSYTAASWSYLTALYELAERYKGASGCLVECGCQNGGTAAALALGFGVDRQVWLFDNFEGVPEPTEEDGGKAHDRWASQQPHGWAHGDKAHAREAMKGVGVKGAKIIAGEFADTFAVTAHKTGAIGLLHIDATTYASTKLALERFYPYVVAGGLVILSAFAHWQGIRKAFNDYFGDDSIELHTVERGAYFIK